MSDEHCPYCTGGRGSTCPSCDAAMTVGVLLVSVADGETDQQQPRRTGRTACVREDALWRLDVEFETLASANRDRALWVHDAEWRRLGLPGGAP